jgi:predicted nucleic acid-binding protein
MILRRASGTIDKRLSSPSRRSRPRFPALDDLPRYFVDEIFAIEAADVDRAKIALAGSRTFSARDALHVAIMERHGVDRILSFDAGFDPRPGIRRISAIS